MGRLTSSQLRRATASLTALLERVDFVEVGAQLITRAGDLAETHALRAGDAVHLAAAVEIDDDTVVVAGDRALLRAAADLGLMTASTSG